MTLWTSIPMLVLGLGSFAGPRGDSVIPLSFELELSAEDELLSYSWDGRGAVPVPPGARRRVLPYGERGMHNGTQLYLPFHSLVEPGFPGPDTLHVKSEGAEGGAGRFGEGLFLPTASAACVLDSEHPWDLGDEWTMSFWLRLEAFEQPARILDLPGFLRVSLNQERRLVVRLDEEHSTSFSSARALPLGQWVHVGLSMAAEFLTQFRLVVGNEARGRRIDPVELRSPRSLRVGAGPDGTHGFVGEVDDLWLSQGPSTTARLLEAGSPVPDLGVHRLELTLRSGRRDVELWYGLTGAKELRGSQLSLGRLEGVVADEDGLSWVPARWRELRTLSGPMARTTQPVVFLGGHRALLFGGETRDTHLPPMVNTADTWLFWTDAARWERVLSQESPPPRCHQAAAYSPDHDEVLVVGGFVNESGKHQVLDDTWTFDVGAGTWSRRASGDTSLGPVSDAGIVYDAPRRRFLLLRDRALFAFYPDADRWERLPLLVLAPDGQPDFEYSPGGSMMFALNADATQGLVFGGYKNGAGYLDHTAIFDPEHGVLQRIEVPAAPSPRVRAGFAYDSVRDQYVLFGGVQDEGSRREADLWLFDPTERVWTRQDASGTPSARGGYYGMAHDPALDRFFLLCGRHSKDRFLDEAWELTLAQRSVGRAVHVLDRAAAPEATVFELNFAAPEGAEPSLRFRSSSHGVSWSDWSEASPSDERARYWMIETTFPPLAGGERTILRGMGFHASETELPPGLQPLTFPLPQRD